MESAAACGVNSPASFARYDHDTHSLRTAQRSLFEDLTVSSVTLPRWGSMQNGVLYQRQTLVHRTDERESGLLLPTPTATNARQGINSKNNQGQPLLPMAAMRWPTPCSRDYKGARTIEAQIKSGRGKTNSLPDALRISTDGESGNLNPPWAEWLMGWPPGWTELKPSATDKYRNAQPPHGDY